jgi:hypothetical protein
MMMEVLKRDVLVDGKRKISMTVLVEVHPL